MGATTTSKGNSRHLLHARGYDPNPPEDFSPAVPVRFRPAPRPLPADPMADFIDEGAEWWIARSDRSPNAIQAAFSNGAVGCVLYESMGAVTQLGKIGRQYLLGVQLTAAGQWDVDLCLSEIGIYLEEPWNNGKGPVNGW